MPTITYNTVNNPMNPTSGKSLFYSFKLEGLGGNVKAAISNVVEAKYFHPTYHKRNVLAFHFVGCLRHRLQRSCRASLRAAVPRRRTGLARL